MVPDNDGLRPELEAFELSDLAAGVGALQLLPENADHLLRLERLAAVVSRLRPGPERRPSMSAGRWRQILNNPPLAAEYWVGQEDPYEEPFTETVPFYGGSYTVLPGLATGSVGMLRRLTHALYQEDRPLSPAAEGAVERLIRSVLWLSNAIASRAGLERGVRPIPGKGGPAIVPPSPRFATLKTAVTFTRADVDAAIGASSEEILRPLTLDPGGLADVPPIEDPDLRVLSTPIMGFGDRIVVLTPTALVIALIHRIVVMSKEGGAFADLALRYRNSIEGLAMRSLLFMGFRPVASPVGGAAPKDTQERYLRFDRDKLAHVLIVTDPLDDYNIEAPFGHWSDPELPQRVEDRILAVRDEVLGVSPSVFSGVLHLVVLDGVGRTVVMGFTQRVSAARSWTTVVSAHDLEIIAHREGNDPLAIWRFARASDDLRERTRVFHWGALDEYALYKDHADSFYLGDGSLPKGLNIQCDYALDLRMSYLRERDPHGVFGPDGDKVVNVQRWTKDQRVPLYVHDPLSGEAGLLVEGLPVPVWVVPHAPPDAAHRLAYDRFCEVTAYWVWQASPILAPWLESKRTDVTSICIELELVGRLNPERGETDEWLSVSVVDADVLLMRIAPGVHDDLATPDNRAERKIVAGLLVGIGQGLCREATIDAERATDVIAPLGPKKLMSIISLDLNPLIGTGPLPRRRLVADAEDSRRLDELGAWLQTIVPSGRVAPNRRVEVLNGAVAFFFDRLSERVAELSPVGLVEFLIQQNEALVRDEAERRLSIPTRTACFGLQGEIAEELTEHLPALAIAAISNRFLIEYIAAVSPTGEAPVTYERYDELLSLSSQIVNKGIISDAIHFGLADTEVSLLESGRLGLSRQDAFARAINEFRSLHGRSAVRHAERYFKRHWDRSDGAPPDDFPALDKAFGEEFGLTATQLAECWSDIDGLVAGQAEEPKRRHRDEIAEIVARRAAWTRAKADEWLRTVSLERRGDFFGGVARADLYPWRFNRNMSYLRRPFVRRQGAHGDELLWGSRNLYQSGAYLLDLCVTGRLKAKSRSMNEFIGRIRNVEPEGFNDDVAAIFEAHADLVIRRRVAKIGTRRIERTKGQDLGDIDVLVVNPATHRVLAIETKDFEVARTPAELANEVEKLIVGVSSAVTRHVERIGWIRENMQLILDWLKLPGPARRWRVEGLIAVSEELMSPLLQESPVRVITFDDLSLEFQTFI